MAADPGFEQVKGSIMDVLESCGVLSEIRALLRVGVYKAMHAEDLDGRMPPTLCSLSVRVIVQFLEFHGMHHTLSVFCSEAGLGDVARVAELGQQVGHDLGLATSAEVPALEQLVSEQWQRSSSILDSGQGHLTSFAATMVPPLLPTICEASPSNEACEDFGSSGEDNEAAGLKGHRRSAVLDYASPKVEAGPAPSPVLAPLDSASAELLPPACVPDELELPPSSRVVRRRRRGSFGTTRKSTGDSSGAAVSSLLHALHEAAAAEPGVEPHDELLQGLGSAEAFEQAVHVTVPTVASPWRQIAAPHEELHHRVFEADEVHHAAKFLRQVSPSGSALATPKRERTLSDLDEGSAHPESAALSRRSSLDGAGSGSIREPKEAFVKLIGSLAALEEEELPSFSNIRLPPPPDAEEPCGEADLRLEGGGRAARRDRAHKTSSSFDEAVAQGMVADGDGINLSASSSLHGVGDEGSINILAAISALAAQGAAAAKGHIDHVLASGLHAHGMVNSEKPLGGTLAGGSRSKTRKGGHKRLPPLLADTSFSAGEGPAWMAESPGSPSGSGQWLERVPSDGSLTSIATPLSTSSSTASTAVPTAPATASPTMLQRSRSAGALQRPLPPLSSPSGIGSLSLDAALLTNVQRPRSGSLGGKVRRSRKSRRTSDSGLVEDTGVQDLEVCNAGPPSPASLSVGIGGAGALHHGTGLALRSASKDGSH